MNSERSTYKDPLTGLEIIQLTNYKGHSHHFYFTNPGWYDGGKKLLFSSDRNNRTNLYGADLETGEIEQITDIEPPPAPLEIQFVEACKNPLKDEVYFWIGVNLAAVDIVTQKVRMLWEQDGTWHPLMVNCSADGTHVLFSTYKEPENHIETDLLRGYVGFRDVFKSRPTSRILRIPTTGGPAEVVFEEQVWIGHVNTSPTNPNQLTYCHEGPWEQVDNRIFGLDIASGRSWKLPSPDPDFCVGHEYWYRDGRRIGFHGFSRSGNGFAIGGIDFTGSNGWISKQASQTGHVFSYEDELIIGDGYEDGVLKLWKRIDRKLVGPRVLCRHDSTAKIQQLHVHPRFTPDGKSILFTSDRHTGYGNVYLAPIPEFDSLKDWKQR
ncbi:MAG: oligogalacturonate lyase family protein [Chthoniobacteraceae bacterium]